MRKTDFLFTLKEETYESVNQVLSGSPFASAISGYMQTVVASYQNRSAVQLETTIMQQVPLAAQAQTATQLIGIVKQKVVTEVRSRVPLGGFFGGIAQTAGDIAQSVGSVMGAAGSAIGGTLSSIGKLLFKENTGGAKATGSPTAVMQQLGTGHPLDATSQNKMENAFGTSFSDVEMHTDGKAAQLSGNMNARAFTVGNHIAFGQGEHSPGTMVGDALMAHELAHVVQQRNMGDEANGIGSQDYKGLEDEADGAAAAALSDGTVETRGKPKSRSGLQIQRCGGSTSKDGGTKDAGAPATDSGTTAPAPDAGAPPEDAHPAKALPRPGAMKLEVAGKDRTKWRVDFSKKKQAQDKCDAVRLKNIKADDPEQVGKKNWTFYYYPMSQSEAEAAMAAKQKELGNKYDVKVAEDTVLQTHYLKISLKCPEAVPLKAGFEIWPTCYPTEKEVKAQVKKFKESHIEAEQWELDKGMYTIYYKPFKNAASATAAGQAEAAKRKGNAEGMFQVTSTFDKGLNSYVSSTSAVCPPGYEDIGQFEVTTYIIAQEKDFEKEPTVKDPPNLKGTYRKKFLDGHERGKPYGVKTEGSGISISGKKIHYAGDDTYEEVSAKLFPPTASMRPGVPGLSVAVDRKLIKLGTELLVEDFGVRRADDVGGAIDKKHLDDFQGMMDWKDAAKLTVEDKKVCKKKDTP